MESPLGRGLALGEKLFYSMIVSAIFVSDWSLAVGYILAPTYTLAPEHGRAQGNQLSPDWATGSDGPDHGNDRRRH